MIVRAPHSVFVLGVLLAGSACQPKAARIEVSPTEVLLNQDALVKALIAQVKDEDGKPMPAQPVWTSSDAAIAAVDEKGVVQGKGSGTATITAQVEALTAKARVTVQILRTLKLDSQALVVRLGTPTPVPGIVFLNERGEPLPAQQAPLEWSVADPRVAQIADGKITPITVGSTTLRVQYAGLSAEAAVTVTPGDSSGLPEQPDGVIPDANAPEEPAAAKAAPRSRGPRSHR